MLAGLIAFVSPCVVPLLPGYLALLLGLTGTDDAPLRGRLGAAVIAPALFVVGFSLVFISQGLLFGRLGGALAVHAGAVQRVAGAITVLLALGYSGLVPALRLQGRAIPQQRGLLAAPVLGVACGLSWSPCLTPALAVALTLATAEATAAHGAILMTAFCAGLGVPFLLLSLGLRWTLRPMRLLREHARAVHWVSSVTLGGFGLVLLLGLWQPWVLWLRSAAS